MTASLDLAALENLLEQERVALRSGNLAALGETATRKSDLVDSIARNLNPGDTRRLDVLKSDAQRNQHLIMSAMRGVRAARSRMNAILQAQSSFDTYDTNGRTKSFSVQSGEVERRA